MPLCTAAGDQSGAAGVSDGAGGMIVAWHDGRSGALAIYAQRVSAAGVVQWQAGGVPLCSASSGQALPRIVSDGASGAIVVWEDHRAGNTDLYAQRISAAGVAQWGPGGLALCADPSSQYGLALVADGAGGAIASWWDFRNGTGDLFAQRVTSGGAVTWASGGLLVAAAASNQQDPAVAADGAGGVIISWQDWRNGVDGDIYAQRVSAAGSSQWAANGVVVCAAQGSQAAPIIISDGVGGAVIAWADDRVSIYSDIYAQRISPSGGSQWTAGGVALCTAGGGQFYPVITTDGASGAIVAWLDGRAVSSYDNYAQRVTAGGGVSWLADGVRLCTYESTRSQPVMASDGAGGAMVFWSDGRSGAEDIYGQRVSAAGALVWPQDGGAISTAPEYQSGPCVVAGIGGAAVIAWNDTRNGNSDIYAQGVDGTAAPFTMARITSVRDIVADQGGKVRIAWSRNFLDVAPTYEVSLYGIWRQVPATVAKAALARGATASEMNAQPSLPGPGVFRATAFGDKVLYWEGVGTVAARGQPTYTFVAPTLQDSTSADPAWTVFMVDTHLAFQPGLFDSAPDSGYSVDNIAPAAPAGLHRAAGGLLAWQESSATDFHFFTVYGSTVNHLGAGATVVGHTTATSLGVAGQAHAYFLVTATDANGNEGPAAVLYDATAVPGAQPTQYALHPCAPNPFNPATTISFDLPQATPVRVRVYDMAGRLVQTLVDGAVLEAGPHDVMWRGNDASGRQVAAGTYFCRMEAGVFSGTQRMTMVK